MKPFLRACALLCALLTLISGCAAAEGFPAELEKQMAAICRECNVVGASVAYVRDGQVVATYAFGYATKYSAPMTENTKVRLASISKVLVGMAAMFLEEDGLISLDQPLDDLLGFPIRTRAAGDVVTVRSILTHTSSIDLNQYSDSYFVTVRRLLSTGTGMRAFVSGDVRHWAYNNFAFSVLGLALECAAGQTVDQLLDSHLCDALGVDGAFWGGDLDDPSAIATLYKANGTIGKTYESQLIHHPETASNGYVFCGDYHTSARDLGKIVAALASGGFYEGERVISAGVIEELERCLDTPVENFYQAQPLRYRTDLFGRGGIYYHTGSSYGELNMVSFDPAVGDGVVVLTTGSSGRDGSTGLYAVCSSLSDLLYGWAW